MLVNLFVNQQAQEVIFSRKYAHTNHSNTYFNNAQVIQTYCTKHLGMCLNEHLNFNQHVRNKLQR